MGRNEGKDVTTMTDTPLKPRRRRTGRIALGLGLATVLLGLTVPATAAAGIDHGRDR